jgi:hypothetical protein
MHTEYSPSLSFRVYVLPYVVPLSACLPFSAGFLFLREKIEPSHSWALQTFKGIMQITPKVIVTDRELASMNSMETVYPSTQNILCIWHINKNIAAKCKQLISSTSWDSFLLDWNVCVSTHTSDDFQENWASFHLKYSYERPALDKHGCLEKNVLLSALLENIHT